MQKIYKLVLAMLCCAFPFLVTAQQTIENIKINQFGYRPTDAKVAVIANPQEGINADENYVPSSTLEVRETGSGNVVFSGTPTAWNNGDTHDQSGDKVWWFDFSSVTVPGNYRVYDAQNNKRSFAFTIDEDIYSHVLKHAVRAFYYQRCGTPKLATYSGQWNDETTCHLHNSQDLASRLVTAKNDASTEKELSGGWHDAGDYNKYVNFTYNTMHSLLFAYQQNPSVFLDNYNIPESGNGVPDVLDEIKWELDWLIKMQLEDGQVLSKLAVTEFQGASPPSSDASPRYYGEASASAARTFASVMAHAANIYKDQPQFATYADTLLSAAVLSWNWLEENPGYSNYQNTGFSSANPEVDEYSQMARQIGAAAMLFAVTGEEKYKSYFEENYQNTHAFEWGYWYPYENTIQDIMLYYSFLENASTEVKQAIIASFDNSFKSNNTDLLTAVNQQQDAYRAFLKEQDYVWSSNKVKADVGSIFYNAALFLNAASTEQYESAAEDYIHFLLGVNPFSWCFMSNMDDLGAEKSIAEIYHGWFSDGTDYDNAHTSPLGPAPGILSGGANLYYVPDGAYTGPTLEPPLNQPVQKRYRDWNTSWPENSWEITEPAIYYQASLVQLLSKFASDKLPENLVTSTDKKIATNTTLLAYPNPMESGRFYIEVPDGIRIEQLQLIDSAGKTIWQQAVNRTELRLDVFINSPLPRGVYMLHATTQRGSIFKSKIWWR